MSSNKFKQRASVLRIAVGVLLVVASSVPLDAQITRNGNTSSTAIPGSVYPSPNRTLVQSVAKARDLVAGDRDSEVVELLAAILEAESDFFVYKEPMGTTDEGRSYQSLKSESRKILGGLRPAARKSYERQFGAKARRLLDEARSGKIEHAAEVLRRYPHTEAGDEALNLLGDHALDRGRFLWAAGFFRDLQMNGNPTRYEPYLSLKLAICWERVGEINKSRDVLVSLRDRFPNARLQVRGESVELFHTTEDPLVWLQRVSGGPRTTIPEPSVRRDSGAFDEQIGSMIPTNAIWKQPVCESLELEATLQEQRTGFNRRSVMALPTLRPVVDDQLIVMRTPQALVAVDFKTGKRIWQVNQSSSGSLQQTHDSRTTTSAPFEQQVWDDTTFGFMSSNGNALFVVEGFEETSRQGRRENQSPETDRPYHFLSAYTLRDQPGRCDWSIDGLKFDGTTIEKCVFLGPPSSLDGQLFVLAETRGVVVLAAIEASTGNLIWSQPLVLTQSTPNVPRSGPMARHTSSLTPYYADGILICPTGCGAVVAVDLPTRSLRWGYEYPDWSPNRGTFDSCNRWIDSSVVTAGRYILITPVESQKLFCLNLDDGKIQWSIDRKDLTYLAGMHRNIAVTVGRKKVTGIDLDTGFLAPGWPVELPTNSLPSGRGCFTERRLYLPIIAEGKGAVLTIQLDRPARIQCSTFSDGFVPGNLVCLQNRILSQNVDWLQAFQINESK